MFSEPSICSKILGHIRCSGCTDIGNNTHYGEDTGKEFFH